MASGDSSKDGGSRSGNHTNPKKQKVIVVEETLEDRIRELPESLLVQILSWGKNKGFRSFVDYVLCHSTASKIKKFEIHCYRMHKYKSQINSWFSFSVEKNVERVIVCADPLCEFPESFFTCTSLITLNLVESSLVSNMVIAWKSLKSIKLEDMVVVDAEIVNLLSGCPALETMVFHKVGCFRRLKINSSKVKSLTLEGYWLDDDGSGRDHSFETFSPYFQQLELSCDFHDFKCSLVDIFSVVDAKLTFDITCIKDLEDNPDEDSDDEEEDSCSDYHQGFKTIVQDYLQNLSCATELTFGTLFTQVMCILQFKGVPIPELKCKHLALKLHLEKFNLYGAAGHLQASPLVETLNIEMKNQPVTSSNFFFLHHLCDEALTTPPAAKLFLKENTDIFNYH
ncbi:hypothetical protein K7X08_023746 [Anisodus acutangulus]|uniref:F-box/LRR-repeat protein 15/At3g58940/PEG3-like LRR domain-containing protein n=1 Tax=Anisodus acutangulus TaxID=402998 RepID=A0A9Q1LAI6_9SOLA|nr:hypothetical protein K7X08_023746 [Anisodus acutangulus]